jgi:hypothetical protein
MNTSSLSPVTAAPQRLVLHCRIDNETHDLALPLPSLAKLHCPPPPKPAVARPPDERPPK